MEQVNTASACLCALLILAGCSGRARDPGEVPIWRPAIVELQRYDTDHDGQVTRAELEAGIHRDFAAADANHDGALEDGEIQSVNQSRWARDAASATPLVDWNQDGVVDFNEFAAAPRSLFDQLDTNGDGTLSAAELKPEKGRPLPENPRGESRSGTGQPGEQQPEEGPDGR